MKKIEINDKLEQGEIEGLLAEINAYAQRNRGDLEVFCQRATYYFLTGEIETAILQLTEALKYNPYYIDALYNLGVIYRSIGELAKAYECFYKILRMDVNQTECEERIEEITNAFYLNEQDIITREDVNTLKEQLAYINKQVETEFETKIIAPWSYAKEKAIGDRLLTDSNYYIASYTRLGMNSTMSNIVYSRVELRKIADMGNKLRTKLNQPYYLPIALENEDKIQLTTAKQNYRMHQHAENFIGYRLNEPIYLATEEGTNILMAEPILLKKDQNKKSLVLTIFVDGLSQAFLEENGFENCMPKTYRYFADGIHCTNFYSTGEWTYPSMAAYFSGKYTVDHKMFYPGVDYRLPEDVKVLGECLKEAGYHTAKIDGDWRTNPDYGYIRGMDRVLTATYGEAMNIKEVIYEAIDHMETMKETNQYLYINIGELHDITDDYKLPIDVQMRMDLQDLQDERDNGTTSVKQQFNLAKKKRYYQQMKYVDRYLGILFDYLEEAFADEEIIVTLFSDHGQGYLVPNGGFFLADERSKVPLLIKGASKEKTICNEPMSIVDYLPILGKLAGFEVDLTGRRSILPKFFGGSATRQYVVSESLYPGDTYKIALRNAELTFFFESKAVVQRDARVDLSEYEINLTTPDGLPFDDENKKQECLDYVMEHIQYFRIYGE